MTFYKSSDGRKTDEADAHSYEIRLALLCTSPPTTSLFSPHIYPASSLASMRHNFIPRTSPTLHLVLSVLSSETHLLVDNQFSAHGVDSSSNSDTHNNSYLSVSIDSIVQQGPAYRGESTLGESFA